MKRFTNARLALFGLAISLSALASPASALTNPYAKGADPTLTSIQTDGPFAVSTQSVSGWFAGFGGGTVYSPNTPGKYAVVAVCPGFLAGQSTVRDISRRLATHGFVVVTIDTNSIFDYPPSRANQLIAALNKVTSLTTGPVAGKMDTSRLAVAGWSMGGGGTMLATGMTPGLKAGVAFAPWAQSNNVGNSAVPVSYLGGTADTVAPVPDHAQKFYNAMPATTKKMLGVIQGADHNFPQTADQPASYTEIAWMKRFVDNDVRYSQFLNGDWRYASFASNGPF